MIDLLRKCKAYGNGFRSFTLLCSVCILIADKKGEKMKIIVCVDNKGGMAFFKKRQSQDRILREDILNNLHGSKLWMSPYSLKQFKEENEENLLADEQFLDAAGEDDYCFVENQNLQPYKDKITEITVYRWNRDYPADLFLDIDLKDWELSDSAEFAGNSHEKITKERYRKNTLI